MLTNWTRNILRNTNKLAHTSISHAASTWTGSSRASSTSSFTVPFVARTTTSAPLLSSRSLPPQQRTLRTMSATPQSYLPFEPATLDSFSPSSREIFDSVLNEVMDQKHHLVLYDGVCLVCNSSVNFIVDRDPAMKFHFASLQSDFGRYLFAKLHMPLIDSMFLISPSSVNAPKEANSDETHPQPVWYARSTAALRIGTKLQPSWIFMWLWVLLLIPSFLRDFGYKMFAKNRYRLFGKMEAEDGSACRVVTKATRPRYLEYTIKDKEKARAKAAKLAASDFSSEPSANASTTTQTTNDEEGDSVLHPAGHSHSHDGSELAKRK